MPERVQVLIGTRKAAFIYAADERRQTWTQSEPMLAGWEIFHMAADLRHDPPLLYAAANNPWWGPSIARSSDGGKTWDQRTTGLGFPKDMGLAIQNVWYVQPGHESEPGVVYAGTQPPGLFRSEDWGASWSAIESVTRQEFRAFYQGIGEAPDTGSPLHSIEIDPRDPKRIHLAISGGADARAVRVPRLPDRGDATPPRRGVPGALAGRRLPRLSRTVHRLSHARRRCDVGSPHGGAAGAGRLPERLSRRDGHRRPRAGRRLRGNEQRPGLCE
jgi:hypothetical protein